MSYDAGVNLNVCMRYDAGVNMNVCMRYDAGVNLNVCTQSLLYLAIYINEAFSVFISGKSESACISVWVPARVTYALSPGVISVILQVFKRQEDINSID